MSDMTPQEEENRRVEYEQLRTEIYAADRTCISIMGFILTALASVGSASIAMESPVSDFLLWLLGPVFLIAFWYFTEKRYVIIRNTAYIRDFIEKDTKGYQWCTFLRFLSSSSQARPVLPFDPYHLEITVCLLGALTVPAYGLWMAGWTFWSLTFLTSALIGLIHTFLAVRAFKLYGKPLEYAQGHTLFAGAK